MRHPLSARFHELLQEIGKLHDKKQADYGREEDPFANVRASAEWGMPAWVGAMVRATDKGRRLQTYARTGTLENEGVRDSFLDGAVYYLIGLILWEQEQNWPILPEDPPMTLGEAWDSITGVNPMVLGPKPRTEPQAAPTESIKPGNYMGKMHSEYCSCNQCNYPWIHPPDCACRQHV